MNRRSGAEHRHVFHLALERDWHAAQRDGRYRVSTRGASLAEVGFIHASFAQQLPGVAARFYRDVDEPLVVLVIDRDRLDVPVVEESPEGEGETFPHIYGELPVAAVVAARPARMSIDGTLLVDDPTT